MVYRGVVYPRLSDAVTCLGGTAQLLRSAGVVEVALDGDRISLWPWQDPIAVRNGVEILGLPDDPWFWSEGAFHIHPRALEEWSGGAIAIRADLAALPIRYPVPATARLDAVRSAGSRGLKILVDPGHGGEDLGAVDPTGTPEKEIVLAVSRRLADRLARDGFDVRLTRTDDSYPSLQERVVQANRWDADLMLSIHANSAPRAEAQGIETYVLSRTASDPRALALARFENAYDNKQTGGEDLLTEVLGDIARQAQENASNRLAPGFHRALMEHLPTGNRGVRKAPFFVLAGTTMPAFLVELGFLSNAEEAERLRDPGYQDRLAAALAEGVEKIASYLEIRSLGAGR